MTFDSRQVSPLKSSIQKFVSTANGTSTSVIAEGSLSLTNNLNLDSVLVVPSLNYNLLYVSQLTNTLSYVVIFWPDSCVLKDIQTRQTIGVGVRRGKRIRQITIGPYSKSGGSNKFRSLALASTSRTCFFWILKEIIS